MNIYAFREWLQAKIVPKFRVKVRSKYAPVDLSSPKIAI